MINVNFFKKEGNHFMKHVKISVFLILFCAPSVFAEVIYAQKLLPTLNLDDVTISRVFTEIEKGSDYVFLVTDEIKPQLERKITVRTESGSVTAILDQVLANSGLTYAVTGNQIAVYKQAGARIAQQQQPVGVTITGTVVDEDGQPLAGVTIMLKSNRQRGALTDANGRYSIVVPSASEKLVVTCIGMDKQEVELKPGVTVYNIRMESADNTVETVTVSTGMFVRDKASFTGATSTFSGSELREVGNRSLLQNLAVLDPSFVIVDNLAMGSNPNTMPTIEIRGNTSLQSVQDEFSVDPNQPLFVLNGVIVPIERIFDLDINRIESTTILKEAGSTAIYGSRGANGVVVIETIKPKPGEYRVYYNGTFAVDGPDLTVYNMMNSSEKLEFERLAGYYNYDTAASILFPLAQLALDELYSERLARIQRGVNTYWLSEPVRTAFTHDHSLRVAGGSEELAVEIGGKIKRAQGVMKGSGRNTWAGNIMLAYRANQLTISNTTDITGYTATESPYGVFSDFVNASPYYSKLNENGKPDKWLQEEIRVGNETLGYRNVVGNIANPLYNASLKSFEKEIGFNVTNNLLIQYQLTDQLMLKGGLDLIWSDRNSSAFTDPDHSKFNNIEKSRKGTFNGTEYKTTKYNAYLQSFYGNTFNDVHTVGTNVRLSISQTDNDYLRTEAEGYPRNTNGSPNLANSYKTNSRPGYGTKLQREVGAVATFNYDYAKRYLVDFSYSLNGSTTFGSNRVFKPFWSAGLGWNINREDFAKDWDWADILKLRATIGTAGNQNIGEVTSQTIYQVFLASNKFGQGYFVESLGAPNLPWQVKRTVNVGADLRTLRGRLSLNVDVYQEKMDPLIVSVPQIPSTGLKSFPMHIGKLTTNGVDWTVSFSPIHKLEERIYWRISLNGAHYTQEYSGFSNRLAALNETMRKSGSLGQYKDGFSPTDIWAVRSAGIDPASGRELFITKNNELTFIYNAEDLVRVGNTRPDISGAITTTFHYKNFNLFVAMRYSLGGDIYNYALFNKVENITESAVLNNQDKRALYGRWKKAGDHAAFKSIKILNSTEERAIVKTSRFVQRDNYLRASSISLSYDINQNPWLKRNLAIQMMKVSFTTNDIFRFETSKFERGTSYPFARQYSLGLSLNF